MPAANIPSKTAKNFYESMQDTMVKLYYRWLDEREYEDFNDYAALMKKKAEAAGVEFVKAAKRPFGFIFKADQKTFQIKITNTSYDYRRIA